MPKIVADNEENMAICRVFCGGCPSFKPNELQKVAPDAVVLVAPSTETMNLRVDGSVCMV